MGRGTPHVVRYNPPPLAPRPAGPAPRRALQGGKQASFVTSVLYSAGNRARLAGLALPEIGRRQKL